MKFFFFFLKKFFLFFFPANEQVAPSNRIRTVSIQIIGVNNKMNKINPSTMVGWL